MSPLVDPKEARDLRYLMDCCERLFRVMNAAKLPFWIDWGTLLGQVRHGNIIPWDYDADLCMMKADYDALVALFAKPGAHLHGLALDANYYAEPHSCCFVATGTTVGADLGIDVVAYERRDQKLVSLMSKELIGQYPGNYDFEAAAVFPLGEEVLVGQRVGVPHDAAGRVKELFGPAWKNFPEGRAASPLTPAPFTVHRASSMPRAEDTLWFAAPKATLDAAGLSVASAARLSTTDLLFHADRALWGQLHIHRVEGSEAPEVGPLQTVWTPEPR